MSDRVREVEGELSATALRLLDAGAPESDNPCFVPSGRDATIEPIGSVNEICVFVGTRVRYVTMMTDDPWTGLLYNALEGAPPVTSQCIRPLYGPWWEIAAITGAAGCPDGFEGIGGA
jgi:hypothetical protein